MNALDGAERAAHWLAGVPSTVKVGVLLTLAGLAGVAAWNYHERALGATQCLADQALANTEAKADIAGKAATIKALEARDQPDLTAKLEELKASMPRLRANVAAPPQVINKTTCEYPQGAIDEYNAIH